MVALIVAFSGTLGCGDFVSGQCLAALGEKTASCVVWTLIRWPETAGRLQVSGAFHSEERTALQGLLMGNGCLVLPKLFISELHLDICMLVQ